MVTKEKKPRRKSVSCETLNDIPLIQEVEMLPSPVIRLTQKASRSFSYGFGVLFTNSDQDEQITSIVPNDSPSLLIPCHSLYQFLSFVQKERNRSGISIFDNPCHDVVEDVVIASNCFHRDLGYIRRDINNFPVPCPEINFVILCDIRDLNNISYGIKLLYGSQMDKILSIKDFWNAILGSKRNQNDNVKYPLETEYLRINNEKSYNELCLISDIEYKLMKPFSKFEGSFIKFSDTCMNIVVKDTEDRRNEIKRRFEDPFFSSPK